MGQMGGFKDAEGRASSHSIQELVCGPLATLQRPEALGRSDGGDIRVKALFGRPPERTVEPGGRVDD